ncbi:MAG: putative Actinobacterial Holin-X, holin superfamily [Chloroflexota bacterium]|jgi:drug/metabolite transporter (DMT)-like permease|nr:putative Actinobacterial Holin-X, holin superfamily [Chloroflexota bacterium]
MTTGDASRRRENAFTLVKRLVTGGVTLAKLEVQRGRQEMARNLGQLKGGVLRLALAVALGLVFLIALVAFVIAVLVAIGLWWVALILLVVLLIGIGLLAWTGIRRVTSTKFTPEETIAAVKEDVEWAKNRLLKRG